MPYECQWAQQLPCQNRLRKRVGLSFKLSCPSLPSASPRTKQNARGYEDPPAYAGGSDTAHAVDTDNSRKENLNELLLFQRP
jgi:hypothetical protein